MRSVKRTWWGRPGTTEHEDGQESFVLTWQHQAAQPTLHSSPPLKCNFDYLLVTSSIAMLAVFSASRSSIGPRVGSFASPTTFARSWSFWSLATIVALRLDALECVLKWSDKNLAALIVGDLWLFDERDGGSQSLDGACVFAGGCIANRARNRRAADSSIAPHNLLKLGLADRRLSVLLRHVKAGSWHLIGSTNRPHWPRSLLVEVRWRGSAHVLLHRRTLHVVLIEESWINMRRWAALIVDRHLRWSSWRHIHAWLTLVEAARMHRRSIAPVRARPSRLHIHSHRSLVHVHRHIHGGSIRTHSIIRPHLTTRRPIPVVLEARRHLLIHRWTVGPAVIHWNSVARHSLHRIRHRRILHHRIRPAYHRILVHHRSMHVLWRQTLHVHSAHLHSHARFLWIWWNRWSGASLLLTLELIERLFGGQCDDRILTIQLLFR